MHSRTLAFAPVAASALGSSFVARAALSARPSPAPASVTMRMPGFPRFRFPGFGLGSGLNSGRGLGAGFGGATSGGFGFGGGNNGNKRRDASGAGSGGAGNPASAAWAGYNRALESKPILTKALTSLVGFLIGDLLAQKFLADGGDNAIDLSRLARMSSFGFLFHGPTGHYFYGFLDRLIPGKSAINVASKVAIDQVLWAPIFTACFFAYLGATDRKSVQQIVDKIKKDTWTGVSTSWKFWPLAHCINFALIPTSQRLLYVNTLQIGYNIVLSAIGSK
jgi:protein Mpv17